MGMEQQMVGVSNISNEQMQMSAEQIVQARNGLQIKIAEKYHLDLGKFIGLYADTVGDLVETNPSLLKEYTNNPDEVVERVGKIIIH